MRESMHPWSGTSRLSSPLSPTHTLSHLHLMLSMVKSWWAFAVVPRMKGPGAQERASKVAAILSRQRVFGVRVRELKSEAELAKAARGARFNGGR